MTLINNKQKGESKMTTELIPSDFDRLRKQMTKVEDACWAMRHVLSEAQTTEDLQSLDELVAETIRRVTKVNTIKLDIDNREQ